MNSKRAWPRPHPTLGAFLGFVLLAVLVPYSLDYGVIGLGLVLVGAGVLSGAVARGGPGMGFGAGARAAATFVLILLASLALSLLEDSGMIDLSSPQFSEFMPYVIMMESLWGRISVTLSPIVESFISLMGGDRFVDLIVRVVTVIIPAGIGGALSGAVIGKAALRPPSISVEPEYAQEAIPPEGYVTPQSPVEVDYQCPWCGFGVSPHMMTCWNCGGPLQLPPPPQY